ncbi:hypothetical protein HDV00_010798 [Rhizophlyctis rosea]|nr:hypothetical protein HDV00_010798 [Rhizophlyctis rosea]
MVGPDRFGVQAHRDHRMLPYGDRSAAVAGTTGPPPFGPSGAAGGPGGPAPYWTARPLPGPGLGGPLGTGGGSGTGPGGPLPPFGAPLAPQSVSSGASGWGGGPPVGAFGSNPPMGMGMAGMGMGGYGMMGGGGMGMGGGYGYGGMGGIRDWHQHPAFMQGPYGIDPWSNVKSEDKSNLKEKESRTLFIRNIHYDTTEGEIRHVFGRYGDIKSIFDLINRRGMVFLTYWDLRSAERALNELKGFEFRGRTVNIHYSLPKDDAPQHQKCDRDQNQGTLLVTHSSQALDNEHLRVFMSKFGDVKEVKDFKDAKRKFVEFFDSRACVKAFDSLQVNNKYQGGTLEAFFIWDQPSKRFLDDAGLQSRSPSVRAPSPPVRIKPDPDALPEVVSERHRTDATAASTVVVKQEPRGGDASWGSSPHTAHADSWSERPTNAVGGRRGPVDSFGPGMAGQPPYMPFGPMPTGFPPMPPMGPDFVNNIPPNMFPPQMMAAFAQAMASNPAGMGNLFSANPMENPALAMFMSFFQSWQANQSSGMDGGAQHLTSDLQSNIQDPASSWTQPPTSGVVAPKPNPADGHPTPRPSPDRAGTGFPTAEVERESSVAAGRRRSIDTGVPPSVARPETPQASRTASSRPSTSANGASNGSNADNSPARNASKTTNTAQIEQLLQLLKEQTKKKSASPPPSTSRTAPEKRSAADGFASLSSASPASAKAALPNMNMDQLRALASALLAQKRKDEEERARGGKGRR